MEAVDRALGIYIKGVSEETTEVDLQSTFSQFGLITETVIKGERGWALVQFADSAAAAAAAGAGVTSIGGCDVEVAARTPPKPREPRDVPASVNLYLKGLDEETTRDEVEETLGGFGEVTSVKLRCEAPPPSSVFRAFPRLPFCPARHAPPRAPSDDAAADHSADRGFAFAAMDTVEAAAAAVAASPLTVGELSDVEVEMRRSRAPAPRKPRAPKRESNINPFRDLYIKGLNPDEDNEDALYETFGQFGAVDRVILRKDRDFAFVTFVEDGAVAGAVAASGGLTINGETVTVEARKPKEPRA